MRIIRFRTIKYKVSKKYSVFDEYCRNYIDYHQAFRHCTIYCFNNLILNSLSDLSDPGIFKFNNISTQIQAFFRLILHNKFRRRLLFELSELLLDELNELLFAQTELNSWWHTWAEDWVELNSFLQTRYFKGLSSFADFNNIIFFIIPDYKKLQFKNLNIKNNVILLRKLEYLYNFPFLVNQIFIVWIIFRHFDFPSTSNTPVSTSQAL